MYREAKHLGSDFIVGVVKEFTTSLGTQMVSLCLYFVISQMIM